VTGNASGFRLAAATGAWTCFEDESGQAPGAWSVMKNSLGNLAPGTTGQLAAAMRHQLDRIQRRPSLITGFLGQTGLTLDSQPP